MDKQNQEPFTEKRVKWWIGELQRACWEHEKDLGVQQSTSLRDLQRKIKLGIIPKYQPNRGRLDKKYFKN